MAAVPDRATASTSSLWSSSSCCVANEPRLWATSPSGRPGCASLARAPIRPMSATSSVQPFSPSTP